MPCCCCCSIRGWWWWWCASAVNCGGDGGGDVADAAAVPSSSPGPSSKSISSTPAPICRTACTPEQKPTDPFSSNPTSYKQTVFKVLLLWGSALKGKTGKPPSFRLGLELKSTTTSRQNHRNLNGKPSKRVASMLEAELTVITVVGTSQNAHIKSNFLLQRSGNAQSLPKTVTQILCDGFQIFSLKQKEAVVIVISPTNFTIRKTGGKPKEEEEEEEEHSLVFLPLRPFFVDSRCQHPTQSFLRSQEELTKRPSLRSRCLLPPPPSPLCSFIPIIARVHSSPSPFPSPSPWSPQSVVPLLHGHGYVTGSAPIDHPGRSKLAAGGFRSTRLPE